MLRRGEPENEKEPAPQELRHGHLRSGGARIV